MNDYRKAPGKKIKWGYIRSSFSLYTLCLISELHNMEDYQTCFAVLSGISRFTIAAITALKIDTGSSIFAWGLCTFVYICNNMQYDNFLKVKLKRKKER